MSGERPALAGCPARTPARAGLSRKRDTSVDTLRGLAVVFMVGNHILHYWLVASPWRDFLILISVSWAAPLFMFLVGVGLSLGRPDFLKSLRRGAVLVVLGWGLNIIFYGSAPWWTGRVLQTIGICTVLAYPFRAGGAVLAGVSATGLMLSSLAVPWLQTFSGEYPAIAVVFLSEWPVYPWFGIVLLGLVVGRSVWPRWATWVGGVAMAFGFLFLDRGPGLNGMFLPSPGGWLWVLGSLAVFWGVSRYQAGASLTILGQFCGSALAWMGRRALILYFLQFFVIKILGKFLKIVP